MTGSIHDGKERAAGQPLTAEDVQSRLGVLGKNPFTLSLVYTTAALNGLQLTDIEAIEDFPNVQRVCCAENQLTTLSPLRALRLLLSVDASRNRLTDVLDFDIPKCTQQNAWVGGDQWIGSLLRRADLSANRISSIRNLGSAHPFLTELYLAHNDIRVITGVASLRFLRVLDLSHNRLCSTEGLLPEGALEGTSADSPRLEALEILRLGNNQISNIDEVVGLPRLVELDLTHNKLRSISCLESCYRLQKLHLAHNELGSVNELNCLIPLPFLQSLEARCCPFVQQEDSSVFYRARVLRRLQQLVQLDGQDVSAKEKIKALAMHGSEIASRKQVLAKYLPGEEFLNYLPPLEYDEDIELDAFYEHHQELSDATGPNS